MTWLALISFEPGFCATCMDARGLTTDDLLERARRSSLDELTDRTCGPTGS